MSFHFQPDLCPWLSNAGVILDRMDEILVKTVQSFFILFILILIEIQSKE